MKSICNRNHLLTLSFFSLLILNSAQAYCVKKNSLSAPAHSSPTPSPHSAPSSASPSPGLHPPSSTPSPEQSTPPSSDPPLLQATPSSSSPSPPQSTPPSSNPSPPQATPSSSNPSPQQATPSSSSPSPPPSAPSSSGRPPPQSAPPSSNPSTQPTTHPPAPQPQAPAITAETMMDSPDGEVPATSSTVSVSNRGGIGFKTATITVHNEALKKICENTDYPPLCLESISPFFNGKTDIMHVLEMAINASYAQTELAVRIADKIVKNPATPPQLAGAVQDCKENFGDALDNMEAAYDSIADNDIGTLQTMLSAAVTDYSTCNDGFSGLNPLASHNEKLSNMASNCLAIAALHKT